MYVEYTISKICKKRSFAFVSREQDLITHILILNQYTFWGNALS
jgi:hypothetical protein